MLNFRGRGRLSSFYDLQDFILQLLTNNPFITAIPTFYAASYKSMKVGAYLYIGLTLSLSI